MLYEVRCLWNEKISQLDISPLMSNNCSVFPGLTSASGSTVPNVADREANAPLGDIARVVRYFRQMKELKSTHKIQLANKHY